MKKRRVLKRKDGKNRLDPGQEYNPDDYEYHLEDIEKTIGHPWEKFCYLETFGEYWYGWESGFQWKYDHLRHDRYGKDFNVNGYAVPEKYVSREEPDYDKRKNFHIKQRFYNPYRFKEHCKYKYYDEHKEQWWD